MGGNHLILENSPEKILLLNRLYNYNRSKTIGEKLKGLFTSNTKSRAHTRSKWCKILGKAKQNGTARELIDDLWNEGAFTQVDETENGYPVLELDKDELVRVYSESVLYESCRDLNFAAINKFEDGRKIVTDW